MTTRNTHGNNNDAVKLAKTVATAVGAVFLLVGILGFVPGITTDYDTMTFANHHSDAKLLGIFEVSILHNIVHLLFGVAGLAAARNARNVPPYLFGAAIIYLVLTVYGIVIDKESSANFVPVNSADNWLHIVLALGMGALGYVVKKRLDGDTRATTR
jgi:prepilin signal peptidase PulO-like enzyme (type II secretory pathway)